MWDYVLYAVIFAVGALAGVLFGRKNPKRVEHTLAEAQQLLDQAKVRLVKSK